MDCDRKVQTLMRKYGSKDNVQRHKIACAHLSPIVFLIDIYMNYTKMKLLYK